jgi:hypothetical protein
MVILMPMLFKIAPARVLPAHCGRSQACRMTREGDQRAWDDHAREHRVVVPVSERRVATAAGPVGRGQSKPMRDATALDFSSFFWLLVWAFVLACYLMESFQIIVDVFHDEDLSGR